MSRTCFYMTGDTQSIETASVVYRCKAPATICLHIVGEGHGHVPLCDDHATILIVRLHDMGRQVRTSDVCGGDDE